MKHLPLIIVLIFMIAGCSKRPEYVTGVSSGMDVSFNVNDEYGYEWTEADGQGFYVVKDASQRIICIVGKEEEIIKIDKHLGD